MVDPARLPDLLDRLGEEVAEVSRLGARTKDRLLEETDLVAAAKYRFVVAIETCIDAGQHIVSSEGLRAPRDFADVFAVLGEVRRRVSRT